MKKRISLFSLVITTLLLTCAISCNLFKPSDLNTPVKKGDTDSIVINEVFVDEDGDDAVTLTLNAVNSFIQDTRTVMPDKPNLYFSVVGSTSFYDAATDAVKNTIADWDDIDDADCTSATTAATGEHVLDSYYARATNVTSGLTLTMKVGKTYYLTVYGTGETDSPTALSMALKSGASAYNVDYTYDTVYGHWDGTSKYVLYGSTNNGALGLAGTPTTAEYYYKSRELVTAQLKDAAVVKGTLPITLSYNATGDIVVTNAKTGKDITTSGIAITASSKGITGAGQPVILVDLKTNNLSAKPGDYATLTADQQKEVDDAIFLHDSNRTAAWLYVRWTPKTASGVQGYCYVDVSGASSHDMVYEVKPWVAVGEYDLDISLLDSSKVNDILTVHDTLIVWKNQKSKILGTSTFYSNTTYNLGAAPYATTPDTYNVYDGDKTKASVADADNNVITTGAVLYSKDDGTTDNTCKAYVFKASDIKNFQRTVFYVSGQNNVLPPVASGNDGSLFKPYTSVADALNAIVIQRAAGKDSGYTDWNIVVDGQEATGKNAAISFTNIAATYTGNIIPSEISKTPAGTDHSDQNMNLTIRAFKAAAPATFDQDVTFINAVAGSTVNVYLTNVVWNGAAATNFMKFGTDVYLQNTKLCYDSTNVPTPTDDGSRIGRGKIILETAETDVTKDGVMFIDISTDGTSVAYNIEVEDNNTSKSGGYGHNVVSYKYHAVNDTTLSTTDFVKVDPNGSYTRNADKTIASYDDTKSVRFKVSSDYYASDANQDKGYKKTLKVDDETGSATYGCLIVQLEDVSVSASFAAGNYRGTVSLGTTTLTADEAAGTLTGTGAITGTITVKSYDEDNYPVKSDNMVDLRLREFGKTTERPGITPAENVDGTFFVYLSDQEDSNATAIKRADYADFATYIADVSTQKTAYETNLAKYVKITPTTGPDDATYSKGAAVNKYNTYDGEVQYTFTVELNQAIFSAAPGTYYLRIYFELGDDDNPTPFSETFVITIK